MIKREKYAIENIVIVLILTAGVLLSLFQFLYNRSLWLDEAMLALNIIHKNSFELLKPLDYSQVAPVLFLQIEKLFSMLLPNTEYGLRIFPLFCFWASLYFFYKIIKKQLHNGYAIIFALSLFVFNRTLIIYSSEVKQYMTDVLVLLGMFYFVLKDYKKEKNKYYVLGIVGVIAVLMSNVAPVILFICGFYLVFDAVFVEKKVKIIPLVSVFAAWSGIFLVYYIFFIYKHPTQEIMIKFWSKANAFLPHDSVKNICTFFTGKTAMIIYTLIPAMRIIRYSLILFLLTGIIGLTGHKKPKLIILTCGPILLQLFLSTFQLYPFDIRLILYTLPCIMIICSVGFEMIIKMMFSDLKIERFRLLAVIVPALFFLLGRPVLLKREEIKKSIQYIQENNTDNEPVYIYYGALRAFQYYNDIGFIKIQAPVINGTANRDNKEAYMDELGKLHGKNWLLFSHVMLDEEKFIINRLDSIGHDSINAFQTSGSSAYFYDFGEPTETCLEQK
jgi:hypothetical protein